MLRQVLVGFDLLSVFVSPCLTVSSILTLCTYRTRPIFSRQPFFRPLVPGTLTVTRGVQPCPAEQASRRAAGKQRSPGATRRRRRRRCSSTITLTIAITNKRTNKSLPRCRTGEINKSTSPTQPTSPPSPPNSSNRSQLTSSLPAS